MVGGKLREKDTMTADFWDPIFTETDFKDFIRRSYQIGGDIAELELDIENE